MESGQDEYGDDEDTGVNIFQLPKMLRGWLFLERASHPVKEHSGILNMTGGMHIDKLKKATPETLPEHVLRDTDGRQHHPTTLAAATGLPLQEALQEAVPHELHHRRDRRRRRRRARQRRGVTLNLSGRRL